MDYILSNKEAWEETFDHRRKNWGENNYKLLLSEELPFFEDDVVNVIKTIDFSTKHIAQFCCNNGRELLSLMKYGSLSGVGFDIAENILEQAVSTAKKADIKNCEFVSCNILDIPKKYHNSFDFILLTVGAITWFKDLEPLFQKVSDCLKPNGILLLNDFHPFVNMLSFPGDKEFEEKSLNNITYPYFKNDPWIENQGMAYISNEYDSKTFTSFSHTMSKIVNSILFKRMRITRLDEFDYDIGFSNIYDKKGYPLSFLLLAEKS